MTTQFHFLLLPEFSVMGFVSAIEPLRVANRYHPQAYAWQILSLDGEAVQASNGMSINVDGALATAGAVHILFVVAGFEPLRHYSAKLAQALRRARQRGAVLGALDTGAFVLAQAQLIGTQRVTLHWEAHPAFAQAYPQLKLTHELFEIGPGCISCAGGTAGIDLMLALIDKDHGHLLATQVSEQFVLGRIRAPSDQQRMDITARYDVHNAKVVLALKMMESHLEDPLSAQDLAAVAGVTARQLERLFQTHLRATPLAIYLGLRLARAQTLLQQTDLSVAGVRAACGFASGTHFSRAYQQRFGVSPRADRSSRTPMTLADPPTPQLNLVAKVGVWRSKPKQK